MQESPLNLELVQATAEQVVQMAKQIEVTLDYSGTTLPQLEQFLVAIIQVSGGMQKLEAEGKLMPLVISFAMYFGETVRRSIGGEWAFQPEVRMTPPFIHFDRTQGATNTANLNVIASVHDFLQQPDRHAIAYSYATYEKIYRGLPPYDNSEQSEPRANGANP